MFTTEDAEGPQRARSGSGIAFWTLPSPTNKPTARRRRRPYNDAAEVMASW